MTDHYYGVKLYLALLEPILPGRLEIPPRVTAADRLLVGVDDPFVKITPTGERLDWARHGWYRPPSDTAEDVFPLERVNTQRLGDVGTALLRALAAAGT